MTYTEHGFSLKSGFKRIVLTPNMGFTKTVLTPDFPLPTISEVGREHKVCFGASLRLTKGF